MPNCFTLTRKGKTEPEKLTVIDEELCAAFGEPVDDVKYLWGWYDIIGLYLALGKTFDEILASVKSDEMLKVAAYLKEHYEPNAWYAPRSITG